IKNIHMKKTLVIGASENPERYSNKAIRALLANGQQVVALGLKNGSVQGIEFHTQKEPFEDIDTVTLYVGPQNQKDYYSYIIGLKPRRVIFNPGTENPEFIARLKAAGIYPEVACTLILLATGQYED
ncbi:MAG TPA: CoA-binding protein, partial [Prolixibacteraceae bacterium]|nr:CoA-binding protein [Prolixibacteraceae bacterium]